MMWPFPLFCGVDELRRGGTKSNSGNSSGDTLACRRSETWHCAGLTYIDKTSAILIRDAPGPPSRAAGRRMDGSASQAAHGDVERWACLCPRARKLDSGHSCGDERFTDIT